VGLFVEKEASFVLLLRLRSVELRLGLVLGLALGLVVVIGLG